MILNRLRAIDNPALQQALTRLDTAIDTGVTGNGLRVVLDAVTTEVEKLGNAQVLNAWRRHADGYYIENSSVKHDGTK